MEQTVGQVFLKTAKRNASKVAMKHKRSGRWESISWGQYAMLVSQAARGFIKLGLQPGGGVSIIGFNSPEWVISDIAAIRAGGVATGIYTTNAPEQCHYVAEHSGAQIVVVEDDEQLQKFLSIRSRLPELKAIVLMYGEAEHDGVYTWAELLAMGDQVDEAELTRRDEAQKPDDLCTLIYTSGTTGNPKGVMLSHTNLVWISGVLAKAVEVTNADRQISYLPLSHVAEQILTIHAPVATGSQVWFAQSLDTLGDDLKDVRPTFFLAVPRVWEKIQAKMQAAGAQASPLKKKIGAWAKKQGLRGARADQRGKPMPLTYKLADRVVYSKVREALGLDACRIAISGAAPISHDTLEYFASLGINIMEGYGLSETSAPTTISQPGAWRLGTVGKALPGTRLKIASDGEILIAGPHIFKGYYKNPEATAETMDGEWFKSGDVGEIDADGYLRITDRKKELIITAGGKNISPAEIEGELKTIDVIAQAVAIGDARKYIGALLTLDPELIADEAKACGSSAKTPAEAMNCDKFRRHLQGQIDRVNSKLAQVQQVKRWVIIPQEFTIEGGELTPTMKLKRRIVNEKYGAEIESLYQSRAAA